jgi:hypothetical protein
MILPVGMLPLLGFTGEMLMAAPASEGIDLFKIVGRWNDEKSQGWQRCMHASLNWRVRCTHAC